MSRRLIDLKATLDALRVQCGDSEFGYRMQALFAHLMLRRGFTLLEINARGHPDVRSRMNDVEALVQVKTSLHSSASTVFELTAADLYGIEPKGNRTGFLAFLDSAEPVSWIVVPFKNARQLVGRPVPVSIVRAEADRLQSEWYSDTFMEVVDEVGTRLFNLTYQLLRRRALEGRAL